MRATFAGLIAVALLVALPLIPAPYAPLQTAAAWHAGAVECAPNGTPVSDGVIGPGEYGEDYFDGATKILVYVGCDNSTQRLLHVGLVSPWSGWVGLLVQASDTWDGFMNEVRISYTPSSGLQVMDAYGNFSAGPTRPDSDLGGSTDVGNATTGTVGAARVYEFSVPLRSLDRFDSRLNASGPYNFDLEYSASDPDLNAPPTAISELHSIVIEPAQAPGAWTTVEFAVAPASLPTQEPTMLVSLRDRNGYPVASVQLEVFVRTAFGFYDVGPVITNEQGVAAVSYAPRDKGTYVVGAAYTGGYGLLASVAWRVLNVGSASQGGDLQVGLVGGGGFELKPVEALIVVVVGSVWATYAYAFYVTRRAMRKDRTNPLGQDNWIFK